MPAAASAWSTIASTGLKELATKKRHGQTDSRTNEPMRRDKLQEQLDEVLAAS